MAGKVFEVGDVLPATTQLRITFTNLSADEFAMSSVFSNGDSTYILYNGAVLSNIYITSGPFGNKVYDSPYDTQKYVDVNISNLSLEERTISYVDGNAYRCTWEDINAQPIGFSITYNTNGGSAVSALIEQTNLPSPLPTTTKANHVFAGWYYDNLFTQKATAGDELTTNVTLYAKWYTPTTWCEDIANAIREKDGSSGNIKHVDFADRIEALPSPKEEETKTVTPDFSSGNVVVTPTSGKVMTQVTISKDTNLIADNIKKDVTLYGITGSSFIAIELTQAQYDALTTKDSNTYYLING